MLRHASVSAVIAVMVIAPHEQVALAPTHEWVNADLWRKALLGGQAPYKRISQIGVSQNYSFK